MPDNNEECDREDKEISQGSGQDHAVWKPVVSSRGQEVQGRDPERVSEGPCGRGGALAKRAEAEGPLFLQVLGAGTGHTPHYTLICPGEK